MKARKQYACIACGASIEVGEIYDRLYVSPTESKPFCQSCIQAGMLTHPRDFLIWVGSESYPTIEEFIEEASLLGVNKRVPAAAGGISRGSRGFLIHDEGDPDAARIFGCFVVAGIFYVVPEDVSNEFLKKLWEAGIEPVYLTASDLVDIPRLCGNLVIGATYYYGEPDMEEMAELILELGASAAMLEGGIITFRHPIPYPGKRFRGIRYLEPGLIPPLDELGIKIFPWKNWEGYKVYVERRERWTH